MDTFESIGQAVNINTLTYPELREHRDQVNARLKELEGELIDDLRERANILGFTLQKAAYAPPAPTKKKYVNPENPEETYGGKGKRPGWLQAKLDEGYNLEDFKA